MRQTFARKTSGSPSLANFPLGPRPGRAARLGQGEVRRVRFTPIGRHQHVRPGLLIPVETPCVPDVIALALAQLVRDRWAAEGRQLDERRGTLHIIVMRQD